MLNNFPLRAGNYSFITILNFIEGAFPDDKKTTAALLFLCIVFLTAALFFVFWKSPLYANAAAQTAHDHTSEWKAYTAGQPMEGGTEQNPVKYYLTEDMTLSDKVEVNGYAVLCLNGHI